MKIGFWNIERSGNLGGNDYTSDRAGLMIAHLAGWLTSQIAPEVLVLCEVTGGGAPYILQEASKIGYRGEYVRVADINGSTSPCSFLVLAKQGYWRDCKAVGATTKRPYVALDTGNLVVAAGHILATRGEKSASEIFAMLCDLTSNRPTVFIGDMNFSFSDDPDVSSLSWKKVHPGIPATHKSDSTKTGSVIDYIWCNQAIKSCNPIKVMDYTDWDTIDHAPICYDVTF